MSNTTSIVGNAITISGLDADWVWSTDTPFTNGIKCHSIMFHPSAANDILIVNDESISGSELMRVKCSGDTDDRIVYLGGRWCKPCIDISDCTLGTAANARVTIQYY